MSSEDGFSPEDTPDCPFCSTHKTLQVRPEEARCFNQDCRCVRFMLEQSTEAGDGGDRR